MLLKGLHTLHVLLPTVGKHEWGYGTTYPVVRKVTVKLCRQCGKMKDSNGSLTDISDCPYCNNGRVSYETILTASNGDKYSLDGLVEGAW